MSILKTKPDFTLKPSKTWKWQGPLQLHSYLFKFPHLHAIIIKSHSIPSDREDCSPNLTPKSLEYTHMEFF